MVNENKDLEQSLKLAMSRQAP